ncbi:hypothetical protein LPJ61_002575 [Coemansia biformis]|uniref:SRA1/Sec31 domain-containing protein n=1 Tax=Coemansia biformis TaxID=1286918 RepID=A0A9W8CZI7_9FUNG|nr:hypothetical protein LPJ61_002575 [Coemansia biformis]
MPPPPPQPQASMPPKGSVLVPTQSTASMASLRSQVESERKAASSSSAYRDFTGGGHADVGHWNDPPTVVFKPQKKQTAAKKAANEPPSPSPSLSPFMIVDAAVTPNGTAVAEATETNCKRDIASLVSLPEQTQEQAEELTRALRRAVEGIDVDTASPMTRRMVDDTNKRLEVLDERLPALDPQLVGAACTIALLIDKGLLTEAADAHRDLMQAGYDGELKWLVGIKRVIELCQKSA